MPENEPDFENILRQIIIRIQFKDKMCVFLTGSVQDTAHLIKEIQRKLLKDPKLYNHNLVTQETNYVETLRVAKKENLTPNICFVLQLSQIPTISKNMAQIIAHQYPNWYTLLEGIKDKHTFLQATKSAKIGEKRYAMLCQYLLISQVDELPLAQI